MIKRIELHTAYVTNEDPKWDISNIETAVAQNDSLIITQVLTRIKDKQVFEFLFQPEESFGGKWCFDIISYEEEERPETQEEFDKATVSDEDFSEVLDENNLSDHWDTFRKVCVKMKKIMDE